LKDSQIRVENKTNNKISPAIILFVVIFIAMPDLNLNLAIFQLFHLRDEFWGAKNRTSCSNGCKA
jgi:hypothetical protein